MTVPSTARPGRNEPCHCGSGKKYKHCCLEKDEAAAAAARAKAAAKAAAEPVEVEVAAADPKRAAPKTHTTHQPWKAKTPRGLAPPPRARTTTPRKAGGS